VFKKSLQASLLWTHRWFGILLGFYFILMAFTGVYVLFSGTFEGWLNPALRLSQNPSESYDIARITKAGIEGIGAGVYPNRINFPEDPSQNAVLNVNVSKDGEKPQIEQAYVDPSTGLYTGRQNPDTTVRGFLFSFHRDLFVDKKIGRPIVAINGVLLFILLLSGLYLWWPKGRFLARSLKWPRLRGPYQSIYDLHKFFGIYSLALMLMMATTGIYIAQPNWFEFGGKGEKEKPKDRPGLVKRANTIPFDESIDLSKLQTALEALNVPRRRLVLNFSAEKARIEIRSLPSGGPERNFNFDLKSAELKETMAEDKPFEMRRFMLDLHQGHFWRNTGIWLVALNVPLTLFFFISGVYIWWKRPSRIKRKKTIQA
jgi:uncharacterized iron-regulated membrane protein